jgi:hypothetical protein
MSKNRWIQSVLAMTLVGALTAAGFLWRGEVGASPIKESSRGFPGYSYGAKFVCGTNNSGVSGTFPVLRGRFATEVNIMNHHNFPVDIFKSVLLLHHDQMAVGREPNVVPVSGSAFLLLPGKNATMDDCTQIRTMLGLPINTTLIVGFLMIESGNELTVTTVHATRGLQLRQTLTLDVEQVEGKPIP